MAIITVTPLEGDKVRATFEAPVNINIFDVMMCKLGIEVSACSQITHLEIVETPEPSPVQGYDAPVQVTFACPGGDCQLDVGDIKPDVTFSSVPEGGFGEGKLVMEVTYATA